MNQLAAGVQRVVQRILVALIMCNPNNTRRHIDEEALEALKQSIAQQGLINPITVKKLPNDQGYVAIAGDRRLLAVKSLGMEYIDAVVLVNPTELQEAQITMTENWHREDIRPIEKASGLNRIIRLSGLSANEAAQEMGISPAQAAKLLACLTLPYPLQQALDEGVFGVETGYYLSQVDNPVAQEELFNLMKDGKIDRKELIAKVKEKTSPDKPRKTKPNKLSLQLREAKLNLSAEQPLTTESVVDMLERVLKEARKAKNKELSLDDLTKAIAAREAGES